MSKAIYAQKMTYVLIFHDFSQIFNDKVKIKDQFKIKDR